MIERTPRMDVGEKTPAARVPEREDHPRPTGNTVLGRGEGKGGLILLWMGNAYVMSNAFRSCCRAVCHVRRGERRLSLCRHRSGEHLPGWGRNAVTTTPSAAVFVPTAWLLSCPCFCFMLRDESAVVSCIPRHGLPHMWSGSLRCFGSVPRFCRHQEKKESASSFSAQHQT